jgi:hypothetical protein
MKRNYTAVLFKLVSKVYGKKLNLQFPKKDILKPIKGQPQSTVKDSKKCVKNGHYFRWYRKQKKFFTLKSD